MTPQHSLNTLRPVALRLHTLLSSASIPYLFIGGFATCLYGAAADAGDLDILVRQSDWNHAGSLLNDAGWHGNAYHAGHYSPEGIAVMIHRDGDSRNDGIVLPDPSDPQAGHEIDGLPVLDLPLLIRNKRECAIANQQGFNSHYPVAAGKHFYDADRLQKLLLKHQRKPLTDSSGRAADIWSADPFAP